MNLIKMFFKYSILISGGVPVGGEDLGMLNDILLEGELLSEEPRCGSDLDAGDVDWLGG